MALYNKQELWILGFISKVGKTYKAEETKAVVILSERSESKDLGTDLTAKDDEMRSFLDSASPRSE